MAFIDESGDEGFKLDTGSSEWFVLSAVVVRSDLELETVKLVDEVRAAIGHPEKQALHFSKLSHQRRVPFVERIATAPLHIMSVLVHKPTIKESTLAVRPRLYFYCSRLLLERLSWYCRDTAAPAGVDGCAVKVVFSHRSGTPYAELRDYLERLRGGQHEAEIHWPAIDIEGICSVAHEKRMGLQIADAAASAFYFAVTKSRYGFAEDRYARALKPVIYRRGSRYLSYGLKFVPDLSRLPAGTESFTWLAADHQ